MNQPAKEVKRGAFQNIRDAATCGTYLFMVLLGLVLAGAAVIGMFLIPPLILERTFERARELGWEKHTMRWQLWLQDQSPRYVLAWGIAFLVSGVVFLYFGFIGA